MTMNRRQAVTVMAAAGLGVSAGKACSMRSEEPGEEESRTPEGRRRRLYSLLGDLPDRRSPVSAREVGREDRGAFVLHRLVLDLNGIEPVPAYLTVPRQLRDRAPAGRSPREADWRRESLTFRRARRTLAQASGPVRPIHAAPDPSTLSAGRSGSPTSVWDVTDLT